MKSPPFVLKEDRWFACFDDAGVITPRSEGLEGIYFRDVRLVDRYEYLFEGIRLHVIHTDDSLSHRLRHRFTNPSFVSDFSPGSLDLAVVRQMTDTGYVEKLHLTNRSENRATGNLEIPLHLDFADLMEVRQMHRDRWERVPVVERPDERTLIQVYRGKDGFEVEFRLVCDRPFELVDSVLRFPMDLVPDGDDRLTVAMGASLEIGQVPLPDPDTAEATVDAAVHRFREGLTRVTTSDETVNRILHRSADDLRLLWLWGDERKDSGCVAAGIPHFVALFGRDSLLVSYEFLMMNPELAKLNLRELARKQGTKFVELSEEEPGKILHEWRTGERSHPDIYPYTYATIDAGPLFCFLLGEYVDWTGDLDFVREMAPAVERILEWCTEHGDLDDDGFLEYLDLKQGSLGLVHRGWKDGEPAAVTTKDGGIPEFPIAMVEFQGYYHDGLRAVSRLFSRIGKEEIAGEAERRADDLARKFDEKFWWPEERTFAEALDGSKNLVDAVGTNPGHCLLGDLVDGEKRAAMAGRFFEKDLFTGFGIRTLTTEAVASSPFRYQRGAVWPHDNSIVAFGLARHGFRDEASRIISGIFAAASQLPSHRLPELFSGLDREETDGKVVPIAIACKPQGWAAASPFLLLRAALGIFPDALHRTLTLSPHLAGTGLTEVRIDRLPFCGGHVAFTARLAGDATEIVDLEQDGDFTVRTESSTK